MIPVITKKLVRWDLYSFSNGYELHYSHINKWVSRYGLFKTERLWLEESIKHKWILLGWVREEDFTPDKLQERFPEVFL